jgi:uncharacterized protein (UPF0248 family)
MGPRDTLNKLRWHTKFNLRDAKVTIVHRGAPGDVKVIEGKDIRELGPAFMRVLTPEGEVQIPYHRILRIEAQGRTLWRKSGV